MPVVAGQGLAQAPVERPAPRAQRERSPERTENDAPRTKKPAIDQSLKNDLAAMLNIVNSVYHFDRGDRLKGTVYPQYARVKAWLEAVKQ
jgi:hypothetical protein